MEKFGSGKQLGPGPNSAVKRGAAGNEAGLAQKTEAIFRGNQGDRDPRAPVYPADSYIKCHLELRGGVPCKHLSSEASHQNVSNALVLNDYRVS